jgi:hypothetical protein
MVNSPQTEPAPSAKQLVFLSIMATVVAVIVFLCGVLVGRGVPLNRTPGTTASDVLPGGRDQVAIGEPELPVTEDGDAPSALADLTYFERLNGTEPVEEADTLRSEEAAQSGPDGDVVAGSGGPVSTEVGAEAAVVAVVETEPEPGATTAVFALQVTALRESDEANRVANDLVAAGYPAFVVAPADDAPVAVFRVRVGPFEDRAEAEAAGRRLEAEQRLKPWVIQL